MTTTFGYEFEVAENGPAVLDVLAKRGLVPDTHLHEYHCDCMDCKHDNYGPNDVWLFSAQKDCTVSAEFPSKVLTWGTERAERAFMEMERAAVVAGAVLDRSSGMHVHVAKPPTERPRVRADGEKYCTTRQLTTWRLLRLFMRYQDELADIAAGHRSSVRNYNAPLPVPDSGSPFWTTRLSRRIPMTAARDLPMFRGGWLDVGRHADTYEFRLWNASKAAWRQRLCVALSVAMTEAATAGVNVTADDKRPVEEVLAPWLDNETWSGILRQRYGKGGIAA